jgi:type IV pilus assembly protein PilO
MTANLGAGNLTEDSSEGLSLFGITLNSRTIGIILAVLGIGLAIYGTVQYTLPNFEKIEKNNNEIKAKQDAIDSKTKQITAKGNVVEKVEIAKRKNEAVLELLPTVESMNTLLVDLNAQIPELVTIPNQFGLVVETRSGLKDYKPTEGPKNDQFVENKLNIKFAGTYEDIVDVVRKIERIKPLLQLKNLKLKPVTNLTPAPTKRYTAEQQRQILQVLPPVLDVSFDMVANTPKAQEVKPAEGVVPPGTPPGATAPAAATPAPVK